MKGFNNVEMRKTIENSTNMKEVFDFVLKDNYKTEIVFRYVLNNEAVAIDGYTFLDSIKKVASALQKKGYKRSHIGVISANCYEYLLIYSAIVYSGNVAVLMSKDSSADQIEDECVLADVEVVFGDKASSDKVASVCNKLNLQCFDLIGSLDSFCLSNDKSNVENSTEREDLITIFFTSGTTGKSKAVAMANRSIFGMMLSPTYPFTGQLIVLPLHHVAAMSMYISTMGIMAETHICSGIENFIRDLKLLKSDCTFVVPMLLKIMLIRLRNANWDQKKLGWNLKLLACGGAAFPTEVIEDFDKAGIKMPQFYGMTETGGGGTFSIMTMKNRFSIGNRILYGHEVDIIDGELVIRSCRQMLGYYKDPEETRTIMYGGWMHTGDLARRDKDGYFYLIGRKKNLIILSNGENISPEEIEAKINISDDVSESLVYGDQKFLHVCVFPATDEDAPEDIKNEVKTRIRAYIDEYNKTAPTYKQLHFVEFRDTPFEKNSLGKLIRNNIEN